MEAPGGEGEGDEDCGRSGGTGLVEFCEGRKGFSRVSAPSNFHAEPPDADHKGRGNGKCSRLGAPHLSAFFRLAGCHRAISDGGVFLRSASCARSVLSSAGIFMRARPRAMERYPLWARSVDSSRAVAPVFACCSDLVKRVSRLGFLTNQSHAVRMNHRECIGGEVLLAGHCVCGP